MGENCGENLSAGEYLDVCVFLISSRILSGGLCGGRRRARAREKSVERPTKLDAQPHELPKETPSVFRGKTEGVSKLVSNQTGRRVVFMLVITERERACRSLTVHVPLSRATRPFPER